MQRSNMQQFYKNQLHEQHGFIAELCKKNETLMEVSCDVACLMLIKLCHGLESVAICQ